MESHKESQEGGKEPESDFDGIHNSENEEQLQNQRQIQKQDDENVLNFMDSLDYYLTLMDSLSSTLREGWMELASARHSMGASRISTALLDLKFHHAATCLLVTQVDSIMEVPHFTLCKWASLTNGNSRQRKHDENETVKNANSLCARQRATSPSFELQDKSLPSNGSSLPADEQVQKERSKSLAVFGTLVSPKLRASQHSFETALETLIEVANMRSLMLFAYDQVLKNMAGKKDP
ncbi:hypothetical protein Nepgr_022347 [Nepenthes gracilis]|uniref:Vacuolar ATPase assembly protein VMA22 n=1 Tax=Nepenthes gracilis TaxID=150966 RepID=A0AAD3XYB0_NEPGR|nr:hypothetical protein Nepgr_022347 [Nepenthes gracilis]